MLKIKDNVDLKVLEKFGFIHTTNKQMVIPRYERGRTTIYYECWKGKRMSQEQANEIRVKMGFCPLYDRAIYIFECDKEKVLIEDTRNDVFDLIKADLVEKVNKL